MKFVVWCLLCVAVWAQSAVARAGEMQPFTGYSLTSWTQKDGIANTLIWALAQDHIGYLWLATDAGALRFDGVRFVPWEHVADLAEPRASVRSVFASRNGTVWFGLGEPGGIIALRKGQVTHYTAASGLPEGIVMGFAEGPDGVLWAAGRFGVRRLVRGRWEPAGDGLPDEVVHALFVDVDESLLAATAVGVFRFDLSSQRFVRADPSHGLARSLARDPAGTLWTTDPIAALRAVTPRPAPAREWLQGRGARLLADSRGHLWVGADGQGVFHRASSGVGRAAFSRVSTLVGLSDDGVTDLLEDREGNVWVATRDGLNRLTPHTMTPIIDLGLVRGVDVVDGTVYVGSADAVVAFPNGRLEARRPPVAVPNPPLVAMRSDGRALWIATATALLRLSHDRIEPVRLHGARLTDLTDITADGEGGLWLHDSKTGLWHWRDGDLSPADLPADLTTVPLLASYTDREGRAWFTFEDRRVAVITSAGVSRVYSEADGLAHGPYRALHQDRTGALWLGGNGGLTRALGGTFTTLNAFPGASGSLVTSIVDDETGALWVGVNAAGVFRYGRNDIDRALADSAHTLRATAYDKVNGLAGYSRWFGNRASIRADDGRLWFVAGRGVSVADAAVLHHDTPSTDKVRVESVIADGVATRPVPGRQLPPRTGRLQIDYTVLNLTAPLKMRFRHRLEGLDTDWVDAGPAHSAFYTNLPPREYVFRVMAAGADGVFAAPSAEWRFSIRPMFYQTRWFAASCVLGVILVIGGTWRLHLRRVRQQFALLLGERARLSRAVHDTLLQSMFGVALECDALRESVPTSEPQLRERLRALRYRVESDIREARQSIWNLRSPRLERHGLAEALHEQARQQLEPAGVALRFDVEGRSTTAPTEIEEQLMRIGGEAVANIVRHARATEASLGLVYHPHSIVLTVSDNGRGFVLDARTATPDHIGLTTMRERAHSIGGSLQVVTQPDHGTTVIATVPSRPA